MGWRETLRLTQYPINIVGDCGYHVLSHIGNPEDIGDKPVRIHSQKRVERGRDLNRNAIEAIYQQRLIRNTGDQGESYTDDSMKIDAANVYHCPLSPLQSPTFGKIRIKDWVCNVQPPANRNLTASVTHERSGMAQFMHQPEYC